MDNAAKEFARQIVSELAKIRELVHKLFDSLSSTPRQDNRETIDHQPNASKKRDTGLIHSSVLAKVDPTLQPDKTGQRWYNIIPWWKILEGIGVAAVVWYAVVSHRQWLDLRNNFKVDERAWIAGIQLCRESPGSKKFSPEGCGDEAPDASSVVFKVVFKNFGKTFATKVDSWITATPTLSRMPKPEHGESSTIFPPGGIFNSSTKPIAVTALGPPSNMVYVYGQVWYDDIFHQHHWTKFCYQRHVLDQSPNAFEQCPVFNDCDGCSKQ